MQEVRIDTHGIDGYHTRVEYIHVAVAAAITSGLADAGIGVEAAARQFGLGFLPLVGEDYYSCA